MTGRPDSKWYSTPRAKRRRKGVEIMLSDEAREALDTMAERYGLTRSGMVEQLVLDRAETIKTLGGKKR